MKTKPTFSNFLSLVGVWISHMSYRYVGIRFCEKPYQIYHYKWHWQQDIVPGPVPTLCASYCVQWPQMMTTFMGRSPRNGLITFSRLIQWWCAAPEAERTVYPVRTWIPWVMESTEAQNGAHLHPAQQPPSVEAAKPVNPLRLARPLEKSAGVTFIMLFVL